MLSLINKLKKEKEFLKKEIENKTKIYSNISETLSLLIKNYAEERNKMGLNIPDEMKCDILPVKNARLPSHNYKKVYCKTKVSFTKLEELFIHYINNANKKRKAADILIELFRKNPVCEFERVNIVAIFKEIKDMVDTPTKDMSAVANNALRTLLNKKIISISKETDSSVSYSYIGEK